MRLSKAIRCDAMPWSFCSKSLEHKLALNSWTISSSQSNQISTLLWHAYSLSGILCKRNFVYEYMLLYKLLVWMVHLSNSYYTHLTHNLILMVVAAAAPPPPKPLNNPVLHRFYSICTHIPGINPKTRYWILKQFMDWMNYNNRIV